MQETGINLQKIARDCIGFGEFVDKVNVAIENPKKYLKQQEANISITQIANECLTFGQFIELMNSQIHRGESHVQ